jgi:general stress protein 26
MVSNLSNTQKVDIKNNENIFVILPSSEREPFFKIEGRAEFEDQEVTRDKWRWWYLYWHPEMRDKFWITPETVQENRIIINVYPGKSIYS